MSDDSVSDGRKGDAIDYVREWRIVLGLSLVKLGMISSIDHASLSRYERGIFNIDLVNLNRIANAIGLPYQALLRPPPDDLKELLSICDEKSRALVLSVVADMVRPFCGEMTQKGD